MRIWTVVLSSVLLSASIGVLWADDQKTPKGPVIACDTPIYEFGKRDSFEAADCAFTIRNIGDAELVIDRVIKSCSCGRTDLSAYRIAPNGSAILKARFHLSGRSGPFGESVVLRSNDPVRANYLLRIQGTVLDRIKVTPRVVNIGAVSIHSTKEAVIELECTDKDIAWAPIHVKSNMACIGATIEGTDKEAQWRIRISLIPPISMEDVVGIITVEGNSRSIGVIDIPVFIRGIGPVKVFPRELVLLKHNKADAVATRVIYIAPGEIETFEILSVQCPDNSVQPKVTKVSGGGYMILLQNIHIVDSLDKRVVEIITDIPVMEKLEVPLNIVGGGDVKDGGG
jgi:hypothetical protein